MAPLQPGIPQLHFPRKVALHQAAGSPAYNSGVFFRNNKDGSIWHQAQTARNGGYIFGWTLIDGK